MVKIGWEKQKWADTNVWEWNGYFFFFFYFLPNPGTGLLALAKTPCPSVVGSSPDLGNM